MRQEIAELIHQVVARLVVRHSEMHVHAADQQALRHALHVAGEQVVAVLVRVALLGPCRKRMRRGRDDAETVALRRPRRDAAQGGKLRPALRQRAAHGRADLELRAQELRRHAADLFRDRVLAFRQDRFGRIGGQVAALRVDQQVLFLDADGEVLLPEHGLPTPDATPGSARGRGAAFPPSGRPRPRRPPDPAGPRS